MVIRDGTATFEMVLDTRLDVSVSCNNEGTLRFFVGQRRLTTTVNPASLTSRLTIVLAPSLRGMRIVLTSARLMAVVSVVPLMAATQVVVPLM